MGPIHHERPNQGANDRAKGGTKRIQRLSSTTFLSDKHVTDTSTSKRRAGRAARPCSDSKYRQRHDAGGGRAAYVQCGENQKGGEVDVLPPNHLGQGPPAERADGDAQNVGADGQAGRVRRGQVEVARNVVGSGGDDGGAYGGEHGLCRDEGDVEPFAGGRPV